MRKVVMVALNGIAEKKPTGQLIQVSTFKWVSLAVTGVLCVLVSWNIHTSVQFANAVEAMQNARHQDIENLKLLEAARQRQVVLEAKMLVQQERNLKLAKQIETALEKR